MTTEFRVPDASCGHCKMTIEAAVGAVEGVGAVVFDLDSKKLRVEHGDGVSSSSLESAIARAGYTPEIA